MFIQPSVTTNDVDLLIPAGQSISIGNTGNEPSTVQLETAYPGQQWLYTTLTTLLNRAQTFGPYGQDRTIRIQNRNAQVEYDIGTQPNLRSFPALVLNSTTPVSIVEPAATFTTLTYENNAGLVRLVSAGAHGLTTAIAVGASVYVTWAAGTGVNGLYAVTALDADTTGVKITINRAFVSGLGTPTVAVANTVLTLGSVVVPAWSIGTKGGMVIDAQFSMTNTATAKNIGMSYGGSAIAAVAGTSNASASFQKDVYNRSNGTLITSALAATGHGLNATGTVVITEDTTVDQVFLITAQPAVANNVVTLEGYNVICTF
jgi:hypothetical protein